MRALVKPAAGPGLEIRTVPVPAPGLGEVLVQVRAGGICGTDLHIEGWDPWAASRLRPPRVIGHEFCGTVVACGPEVHGVALGDFISGESHVSDGRCHLCRRGEAHLCEALQIIGVDRDGAFADYVVLPAQNAWKMDPKTPPEVAATMDPFGNAVHTAFATELGARSVIVMGCGPIGLCAILVARKAGAALVVAADVNPYRLGLAGRLGADRVLDAGTEDIPRVVRGLTDGAGADVLLEFSGSQQGLRTGLAALRNGGVASLPRPPRPPVGPDFAHEGIFQSPPPPGGFWRRPWGAWAQAPAP